MTPYLRIGGLLRTRESGRRYYRRKEFSLGPPERNGSPPFLPVILILLTKELPTVFDHSQRVKTTPTLRDLRRAALNLVTPRLRHGSARVAYY